MKRLLVAALLLVAACGTGSPPPPIQLIASFAVEDLLAGQVEAFTRETGIPVDISWGDSTEHADRLISKSGEPVDVIVTNNAADIWRAADRGALRPIESTALDAQPPYLRDPDDYWGALGIRFHAIYHRNDAGPVVASLHDLGNPGYAGRICISSSQHPANRSLIAYLIEAEGVREAERLVRRWVRNLAQPPFASEKKLLEAVRVGDCEYGIASWGGSGLAAGMTTTRRRRCISPVGVMKRPDFSPSVLATDNAPSAGGSSGRETAARRSRPSVRRPGAGAAP